MTGGVPTLTARQIPDSRGRPTVRVEARLGAHLGVGEVPAGASKGADEARTVPVEEAIGHIHQLLEPLVGGLVGDLTQPGALVDLDRAMARVAGPDFARLGANACLPVSRALWQLAAAMRREPLWATLRAAAPWARPAADAPRVHFYMNIFNGGLHALKAEAGESLGRDRIEYQEIMVVPTRASTYVAAMQMGEAIDQALKALLVERFGAAKVSRADEAGFSVAGLGDNQRAIALVIEAVGRAGFAAGRDVKLALDVAAGSFYDPSQKVYRVGGRKLTGAAMADEIVALVDRHPGLFVSVEDGLEENDWPGWARMSAALKARGVLSVGDDLFVTQLPRLTRGIATLAAGAVLIKVNQNGTVGGTLEVMRAAAQAGMRTIISHRSGETLDDSIADLAHATYAFGLKTGDPQPVADFPDPATWVRRAKYLRMVAIEREAQNAGAPRAGTP